MTAGVRRSLAIFSIVATVLTIGVIVVGWMADDHVALIFGSAYLGLTANRAMLDVGRWLQGRRG